MRTTAWNFTDGNGAQSSDEDHDTKDHVSFLTDKCNALARRLHQVETQLVRERAGDKAPLREAELAAPSSYRSAESPSKGSNRKNHDTSGKGQQPPCARAFSAGPNLSPRGSSRSSRAPSHNLPTSTPAHVGDRGGDSAVGKISNPEAGEEGNDGLYLSSTPVGSSSSSNVDNRANKLPLPRERGQGYAQQRDQEEYERHRSPDSRPGIMVPPDVVQAIRDRGKPRRGGGDRMDADALHCEMVEKEIAYRFEIVAGGIEKLEDVFSGAAQILEHRVSAITTISRYDLVGAPSVTPVRRCGSVT